MLNKVENYIEGYQAYKETEALKPQISNILKEKEIKTQKKLFTQLKDSEFQSKLAVLQIQYYIDQCDNYRANKRKKEVFWLSVIVILVTVVALTIYVYKKFYGIKASNETYTEAVEYYEDGKYEPAMNRLEVLFNEGWDGYGIFHYISQIYEQQGEYDLSYKPIVFFLQNYYGSANVTDDCVPLYRLRELYEDYGGNQELCLLSRGAEEELSDILDILNEYSAQKYEIDNAVYINDWDRAVHYCELLINEGANNYELAVQYIYCLMEKREFDKAIEYLNYYLDNMTVYEQHTVSEEQIETIINYVCNTNYFDDGEKMSQALLEKYQRSNIVENFDNSPYEMTPNGIDSHEKENVEIATEDFLQRIDSFNVLDDIHVYHYEGIVQGQEGYIVSVYKNELKQYQIFFWSRNGKYLYFKIGNEWININENDYSSGFDLLGGETLINLYNEDTFNTVNLYTNDKNNNIHMILEHIGERIFNITFKNVKTNKIILQTQATLDDEFYMNISSENEIGNKFFDARLIFGHKIVMLLNMDIGDNFRKLGYSYTRIENGQ
ncbi:MAG: hypothetical protein KH268_07805 [Clostridiales bacterium]|nr:hypothetical protein [Clostridiales bacterium]